MFDVPVPFPPDCARGLLHERSAAVPVARLPISAALQVKAAPLHPDRYESQTACSRSGNKAHGAASIHIGIATGSVNKMTGVRNNAAQMQKNAASKITGINNTNSNNNNTSIDRLFR
jgi:hypothetical protein